MNDGPIEAEHHGITKPENFGAASSSFQRAFGDLVYAGILLTSALLALGLRRFCRPNTANGRFYWHHFDGLIGLIFVVTVTGRMAICSMAIVFAHLVLFRCVKDTRFILLLNL